MFPFYYIQMAQVILKLAGGNKVPENKPSNFVNWGSRKYKYEDLENAVMDNNFDQYLADQGIKGKDVEEIRGYLDQYLQGFKQGKINRNVDGTYTVSDMSLSTDMTPLKRGIFGKIKGDKKRLALGYFNKLLDEMAPYQEPKEVEKPKVGEKLKELTPFTYGYSKFLRRNIFKDDEESEAEMDLWYKNEDKWSTALKALKEYEESLNGDYDFTKTSFKDKNEYLNALKEVQNALTNKDLKSLQTALNNAGEAKLFSFFGNYDDYLKSKLTPEQKQALKEQQEVNQKAADANVQISQQAVEDANKQTTSIIDDTEPSLEGVSYKLPEASYKPLPENLEKDYFWKKPGESFEDFSKRSSKFLDYKVQGNKKLSNWEKLIKQHPDFYNTAFLKEGGILKGQKGLYNPESINIRNTTVKDSYNRTNNLLNAQSTLDYLGTINSNNFEDFNKYEDLYDSNYENTYGKGSLSKWGTHNLSNLKFDPNTQMMQRQWNSRILNKPIFEGFTGWGNSGDRFNTGSDGRFGNMTVQRTLGRGIDDEVARLYNSKLRDRGLEYYKASHGGYRIRKILDPLLNGKKAELKVDKPVIDTSPISQTIAKPINKPIENKPISNGQAAGEELGPNNLRANPNMIGNLRYGLTQWFNNRQKYNPKVAFTDAPTLYSKVQYNLPAEVYAQQRANNFRRIGANMVSADPNENAARAAQFESKAQEAEMDGKMANWQTYAKTSENAQKIQNTNTLEYIDNANKNKMRAASVAEAKAAFERAKDLKRGSNLNNWLFEKEKDWRDRIARQNTLEENVVRQQLASDWETAEEAADNEFRNAKLAYGDDKTWETSDAYKRAAKIYKETMMKAQNEGNQRLWNTQSRLYGTRLLYGKKGGSLSFAEKLYLQNVKDYNRYLLNSDKEMNKLLRFSISEGNKTIRGLSKYSADLIKNSLK